MTVPAMRIRPATESDVDFIFRVHRSSVETLCRREYSAAQLALWLDGRDPSIYLDAIRKESIWVAEGDRIVGFVEIDGFEVTKLFVAEDGSFRGVGKQLLQTALNRIAASGAPKAYLEATLTAVKFYEKYGFRAVGQGVFTRGNSPVQLEIVKMELDLEGSKAP
ncbi:GNAT family N-acetyltransferase [Bradyrhizobium centrosematis]|uniref:GNAT family N-acetyltransferase n=1 Tax=Bradyrhizobium centrosematis TaxID=1300039 RepID=UPI00388D1464